MKEKLVDRIALVNYINQEISQNRVNIESLLILLKCDAFTPKDNEIIYEENRFTKCSDCGSRLLLDQKCRC